jgi:hypothetical protein
MLRTTTAYLLFGPAVLLAQSGAIAGSVTDMDHKAVPKAAIRAKNDATGASFSTESATNGSYTLSNIPAGRYTLSSFVPGMMPYQHDVTVPVAETLRLDFKMDDFQSNTTGEDREFYATLWYPKEQPGRAPRARGGKPDLSGVWRPALPTDWGHPEPLPWAAAKAKEWQDNHAKDLPQSRCLPLGMDLITIVTPIKLVQTPKLLVMLFDEGDLPRQVFLDGRSHPKEYPLLAWAGHSIGHWDGDTLVVDSRGFNDKSWIGFPSHPHTEQLHVTERFRRPDYGHLDMEITIDDPGAFAKPWTYKKVLRLAPPGEDVEEYICNENNRDLDHYVGQ